MLTWQPLRLLTFYRSILAGLLTVLYFSIQDKASLGIQLPWVYAGTCTAWLAFSIIAGFTTRLRRPGYRLQAVSQILVDIAAITLLIFSSNGPENGLGILMIIAVVAGSILLPGRMAFLFAAVATMAIMGEQAYSMLLNGDQATFNITRSGLLGLTLFATAGVSHLLVRRIHESEALARQRGVDIDNLARLNAHIVQHLQAGIIVTDYQHNIRLMNDTARKLLDYPFHEDGQSLEMLSPDLYRQLLDWRRHPEQDPTLLKVGTSGRILPHFTLIGTAEGLGALIFLEDTAAMEKQAQQIKLASLGRLTASIAHEIRNPLGAISHATQLLDEDTALNAGDRRLMTIIGDNTARVNAIVENILQLSRPGTAIPQTLALHDWLARFVEEFVRSGSCTRQQIEFRVDPADLDIYMDPSLLHQVVWNLCQNAIHHATSKAATHVQLVAAHKHGTGTVHLDIIDNGPGIAPDMADKIFEPFFTTSSSGTGLGLYIAREICESNQAEIVCRSVPDGGSCFRITFPAGRRLPVASFTQATGA